MGQPDRPFGPTFGVNSGQRARHTKPGDETMTNTATKTVFAAAIIAATLGFQVTSANAYSAAVKRACMGDYFNHCAHTKPGSAQLNSCMRKAGPRLSRGCVGALVKAGMVSKSEVKRRAAQK